MSKVATIVFADTNRAEGLGRVVNALTTAKEFREAGEEAVVIFDGAGTKWIDELGKPDHRYHQLFERPASRSPEPARTARGPTASRTGSSRREWS